MPDQTSIFENKDSGTTLPPSGTGNTDNVNTDAELTNLLAGIKNERGEPKYKSLKDALVGLQHAQTHIPKLNADLSARDQELERLRKEADRIAELENSIRSLTEKTDTLEKPPPVLSEQNVAELVDRTLSQREQIAQAKANQQAVVNALVSKFGDKAEQTFNEAASELGMTVAEFNVLAAKNPKLVFKTLGITGA